MQVKEFIQTSLGGCSVPVNLRPNTLKQFSNNFYNFCYNVLHAEMSGDEPADAAFSARSLHSRELSDPQFLGHGGREKKIRRPILPADFGAWDEEARHQAISDGIGVDMFPIWPPDMFAVTGTLLERSGAYQLIRPSEFGFRQGMKLGDCACFGNVEFATKRDYYRYLFSQGDSNRIDLFGDHRLPEGPDQQSFIEKCDPYSVCGLNRFVLRLIGLIWTHGALTVILPPAALSGAMDREWEKDCVDLFKLSIEEQIRKACDALRNYGKFFSTETDQEMFDWFREDLLKSLRERYLHTDFSDFESHGNNPFKNVKVGRSYCAYLVTRYLTSLVHKKKTKNTYEQALRDEEFDGGLLILWALEFIQNLWSVLTECEQELAPFNPLRLNADENDHAFQPYFPWWRAAARLLIISDEAGKALGFSDRPGDDSRSLGTPTESEKDFLSAGATCKIIWEGYKYHFSKALSAYNDASRSDIAERGLSASEREAAEAKELLLLLNPRTLTRCFDDELGSVLPKARTAQIGCTIRSLSHNLALLPPRGRVRARWARSPSGASRETLNILMIPYPFRMHTRDFQVAETSQNDSASWGSFKVNPGWLYGYDARNQPMVKVPISQNEGCWEQLRLVDKSGDEVAAFASSSEHETYIAACHENLLRFVLKLAAQVQSQDINAIVFPEASLSFGAFEYLANRLPRHLPALEIFVAGLCSAPNNMDPSSEGVDRVAGNFVATYIQDSNKVNRPDRGATESAYKRSIWQVRHIRGKHHRWRLDKRQLASYALSHTLRPDRDWWEDFEIRPREMLFSEFQAGSVMTALICEDLARIEPCQVALRAVGPNLVFVLLMDSAQVVGRWPHQYAGVLADDPGSSVMTLTSFGLIERASRSMNFTSRSIGMWREPTGDTTEIDLPPGFHAQLLTLRKEFTPERTLDARTDNGDSAIVWKFAGLAPLKIDEKPSLFSGIDDPRLKKLEDAGLMPKVELPE